MQDQKEKQQFLFQEVIQKNYDPEQFQEFLVSSKQGGDDLANWSMSELSDAVQRFQKVCRKQPEQGKQADQAEKRKSLLIEQKKQQLDEFLQSQQPQKGTTKSKQEQHEAALQINSSSDTFSRVVPCVQTVPGALHGVKNAFVSVIKFDKREGGIFEQAYVCYFVQTQCLGKTVERRYSDFEWLRITLEWLHPGIPIPPIAKKGQFRRYDDKHLRKRLMILEMFLNKLLEIPELRAEQVLENFLKLDDKAAFEKFKSNYKANKKLIPLKTIKTIKGSLTVAVDPKINAFNLAAERHFDQIQPVVKNLYKDFKAAATSLQAVGATLKNLGGQCETLDRIQRKFRKENEISYCPNNFFTIVSEAVGRLAEQMQNQATIFRTEIYSLVKYQSLYMLNIMQSFAGLTSIQQKYLQRKNTLLKKKERLFAEGTVEKWQLQRKVDKSNRGQALAAMLPKETKRVGRIREVYGLFNMELYQQIQRYFATKNSQLGGKLQHCCRNETRMCSQMMMIWVDAETNIISMKENKTIMKC